MSNDARESTRKWLAAQGLRDPAELSERDFNQARELIGTAGFGVWWSIMMFHRQRSVAFLTNAKLGTPQNDCAASVLQGQIAAVDQMHDLLLELADPTPDAAQATE